MTPLYRVHWCNIWNEAAASHSDVGSLMHLAATNAIAGKTLCGREYPAHKGCPSGLTRFCKHCMKKAYAQGQPRGFTRDLAFIAEI